MAENLGVSPRYDPMLAKIIAWGENREIARRRLIAALGDLQVEGLVTNRSFLIRLLAPEEFRTGAADPQLRARIAAAPLPAPAHTVSLPRPLNIGAGVSIA